MIITFDWLKDHLKTNLKEKNLLEQLTNIGLEVESVESLSGDNELFKVAEIIKTEKHPNADRLKVCDVNIGENETKKVVCGAENAKEGLLTIYAPPGAIIPKTQTKLVVAKIRGVTSYGMLCSESELNLSDESDGITELTMVNSVIPSLSSDRFNSDSEQSIPYEVTPLILATTNFVWVLGIIAPGGAYIVSNPSFAFSAPHTTFLVSFSPIFTSQTLSRSAFGCFSVFIISATLNNSLSPERLSTLSTSRPILVSCSKRFFSFRFVFR